MTRPQRHFTDLPSGLRVQHADAGVLHVEGAGFVTRPMAEDALSSFPDGTGLPSLVLIDLRNVSGYEAPCVEVAREWLARARSCGVERIAFVANSSVVRTSTAVMAGHLEAPLQTFSVPDRAKAWLTASAAARRPTTSPPARA